MGMGLKEKEGKVCSQFVILETRLGHDFLCTGSPCMFKNKSYARCVLLPFLHTRLSLVYLISSVSAFPYLPLDKQAGCSYRSILALGGQTTGSLLRLPGLNLVSQHSSPRKLCNSSKNGSNIDRKGIWGIYPTITTAVCILFLSSA